MHNELYHKMKRQFCSSVHRGKVLCSNIRFFRLISVLIFESENKLLPYRLNVKWKIVRVRALKALGGGEPPVSRLVCFTPGKRTTSTHLLGGCVSRSGCFGEETRPLPQPGFERLPHRVKQYMDWAILIAYCDFIIMTNLSLCLSKHHPRRGEENEV